jgi:hypothetical protein
MTFCEIYRAERNAQIVAASWAGEHASSIARRFGVTRRTVCRVRAAARSRT